MTSRASVYGGVPRQSFFPGAVPISSGGSSNTNPPPTGVSARLAAKQAELEGLRTLKDYSARLAADMEALGDRVETLVNSGESTASVLASWQGVFRTIQIARETIHTSLKTQNGQDEEDETRSDEILEDDDHNAEQIANVLPDTMVRIPVDAGINSNAANKPSDATEDGNNNTA